MSTAAVMSSADHTSIDHGARDLSKLLSHLDRAIAQTSGDTLESSQAKPTAYELQKIQTNFEYARALLLRLEHESTSVKVASRRQATQADLRAKRELVRRIQSKIQELDRMSEIESGEEEDDIDETYATDDRNMDYDPNTNYHDEQYTSASNKSELRRRVREIQGQDGARQSTELPSLIKSKTFVDNGLGSREQTLTTDRAEQEQIMESLLSLTRELKSSASAFHGSLENDKPMLEKALQGLDKNVDGMNAAGKRMSTLRRMTEGKGFFGRLKLYGIIWTLWLVALIMVFVLPKLRF